jgi:hypothetical protein
MRWIAAVLAGAMLLSVLPAHAMAQQEDAAAEVQVYALDEEPDETAAMSAGEAIVADFVDDIPDNDELFAGYVQQVFEPELATATYANYAKRCLGTAEYAVYAALKAQVEKIAAGKRASTIIYISIDLSDEEIQQLDLRMIYYCLLVDCPYEMYWHNKTVGCSIPKELPPKTLIFQFAVDSDYAATDSSYRTDTAKTAGTATAKANADRIVQECAEMEDVEKLTAYKDAICALTEYNDDAATAMKSDENAYGDPWQMIYVFDGDPETNVVCEGYAKAFQYLCDQSEFQGEVQCYTVTGTMNGGAHMWNIVTLNGSNYLVDVTNSEEGCVGEYGDLFLAEGTSLIEGDYKSYRLLCKTPEEAAAGEKPTRGVVYRYDEETLALYDASVLTLGAVQSSAGNDFDEVDPLDEVGSIQAIAFDPEDENRQKQEQQKKQEQEQNEQSGSHPAKQKDADTESTILLLCGVGLAGAAAAAYVYAWRPITWAGVACDANGAAMPYATVRLLRGERVLAAATTDANGCYQITARGADTLEVTCTDPETGKMVTTRQALKSGLKQWLANALENENALAPREAESLREAA